MSDLVERLRSRANDKRPMPKPYNLLLDAAEHIEQLETGIKRLSDEDELLSETTDGEVATVVGLAAKLATAESTVFRLERENRALSELRRDLVTLQKRIIGETGLSAIETIDRALKVFDAKHLYEIFDEEHAARQEQGAEE